MLIHRSILTTEWNELYVVSIILLAWSTYARTLIRTEFTCPLCLLQCTMCTGSVSSGRSWASHSHLQIPPPPRRVTYQLWSVICNYGFWTCILPQWKQWRSRAHSIWILHHQEEQEIWCKAASNPDCILQQWYERGRRGKLPSNQTCCSRHRVDYFSSKGTVIL